MPEVVFGDESADNHPAKPVNMRNQPNEKKGGACRDFSIAKILCSAVKKASKRVAYFGALGKASNGDRIALSIYT